MSHEPGYDTLLDLNGDWIVDLGDFDILVKNLGLHGDA